MFKILVFSAFIWLVTLSSFAQQSIHWSPDYYLTIKDFGSKKTKVGTQNNYINSSARMDFSFQMSNTEFMLTKNFNQKVSRP